VLKVLLAWFVSETTTGVKTYRILVLQHLKLQLRYKANQENEDHHWYCL